MNRRRQGWWRGRALSGGAGLVLESSSKVWERQPITTLLPLPPMQRLLKDCEEKAELAKRPSAQQLAPQPAAPGGSAPRRASNAGSSGSDEDSEDGGEALKPAAAHAAPTVAAAAGGGNGTASSGAEGSSGSDGEGGSGGSGEGEGGFVPNLAKLKKLGKRAGPGAYCLCLG